jgi:signal transduction histidine kinase
MRSRSSIVLSLGFGSMIALIVLLGFGAMQRAKAIQEESIATHEKYMRTDFLVRNLPADLCLSGIYVRDYLFDPSHLTGPFYREQLHNQQSAVKEQLNLLRQNLSPRQMDSLKRLTTEVDQYWKTLDPLFSWTPQQKTLLGPFFLRNVVLHRRDTIVRLAKEISRINTENLASEQRRLEQSETLFREFVLRILLATVLVASLVSLASILRVSTLERHEKAARERAENAEQELRQLSRKLVKAQEEERKAISRELHDALGQKLSFIGMEMSTLSSVRTASPETFSERLDDTQRLITETVRAVRDLSMTLRPAMLDELGLGSAVRWQGREFSRRSGIDVEVLLDGELDGLPESHRTAIYRIVQEALTNCGKHAHAQHIRIALYGGKDYIRLTVQDDGMGFDAAGKPRRGLGLIGMEERMKELGGSLTVRSTLKKGTIIEAAAPMPAA